MPQDSAAFRVDGGGYAAQVGRFGETTLPFFALPAESHKSCQSCPAFLQLAGEGFDVRASDRRAEQVGQLGGIADKLDLFAKPFRHCPETDL